ncbi:MAG: rRNA pseudouridine synthase [Clostridiaceae bacterium]|jgi:23S rRNA pseudouridine2605 synthase|nr:rRNA pseudouridine synthase [Clostridiaceae bacterium]
MEDKIRLQKYMAQCGVASRRHAEELIKAGRVKVNGSIITEMGTLVSEQDRVEVDGKLIKKEKKLIYIMLNKPSGYVSTVSDPEGRKTVLDLIDGVNERIYPVGRLDYDTTGLIILTNDGDFAFESTHPGHETKKTYMAEVLGMPSNRALQSLRSGIMLDGKLTAPARVEVVDIKPKSTVLKIIIHEGRNRQVKRMCEAVNHPVLRLKRTAVGRLTLGDLKPGEWRYLSLREVKQIRGKKNG